MQNTARRNPDSEEPELYYQHGRYHAEKRDPRAVRRRAAKTTHHNLGTLQVPVIVTKKLPASKSYKLINYVVFTVGTLIIVAAFIIWITVINPFFQTVSAQWHSGDSRIVSYDFDLGHGGVDHVIAQDYKGQIILVDLTPDGKSSRGYRVADVDPNQPFTVTVYSRDMNQDGRPDLVVYTDSDNNGVILFNDGKGGFKSH